MILKYSDIAYILDKCLSYDLAIFWKYSQILIIFSLWRYG